MNKLKNKKNLPEIIIFRFWTEKWSSKIRVCTSADVYLNNQNYAQKRRETVALHIDDSEDWINVDILRIEDCSEDDDINVDASPEAVNSNK